MAKNARRKPGTKPRTHSSSPAGTMKNVQRKRIKVAPRANHRPHLQPTSAESLSNTFLQSLALAFTSFIFLFGLSPASLCHVLLMDNISSSLSAPDVAFGVAAMHLFYVLPLSLCIHILVFPLSWSLYCFRKRRYHRTHISHMRKDRFLRLSRKLRPLSPTIDKEETAESHIPSDNRLPVLPESGHWFFLPRLRGGGAAPDHAMSDGTQAEGEPVYDTDDESDTRPFVREEWIGIGLEWSISLPSYVKRARNRTRVVPIEIASTVIPPLSSSSVYDLLSQPNPNAPTPPGIEGPTYSLSPPSLTLDIHDPTSLSTFLAFLFACIPHHAALRDGFDNTWLSGSRSITFSHNPNYSVPLWAERLIGDLRTHVTIYNRWKHSSEWLQSRDMFSTRRRTLVEDCEGIMDSMPYSGPVPGFTEAVHLSIYDLSLFLSDEWTNDEMINAGSQYILHQLGPRNRRRIINCHWVGSLKALRLRTSVYRPRHPSMLDRLITNGDLDKLYIPLHIGGNHWTLLEVDIVQRTFAYADSLSENAAPPSDTLKVLEWWLDELRPSHSAYRLVQAKFSMPHQLDNFSCGIVVMSTLASLLLHYPVWTPETYADERMEWFMRLSEYFDESNNEADPDESIVVEQLEGGPKNIDQSGSLNVKDDPTTLDFVDLKPVDLADEDDMSLASPLPTPSSLSDHAQFQVGSPEVHPVDALNDNDDEFSDSADGRAAKRRKLGPNYGAKAGSSFAIQKTLRDNSDANPNLKINKAKLAAFRKKILATDSHAEFKESDPRAVRCSVCRCWVKMRLIYDVLHWKGHRKTKKCQAALTQKAAKTSPLFAHGFAKAAPTASSPSAIPPCAKTTPSAISLPCPGLTKESSSDIDRYLRRSSATGGGAPSRVSICRKLFGNEALSWADLTPKEQRQVKQRERTLFKWVNSRAVGAVFSTNCEDTVTFLRNGVAVPCDACDALAHLHTFQVQLGRKMPSSGNFRFVPKERRCEELGEIYLKYKGVKELLEMDDGRSPWLRFAQGVADGLYKSQDTLLGMVKAMVKKTDRHRKGKKLMNMSYSSPFNDFCNILGSISPRAYKTFRHHFGGPAIRSMRQIRARMPRFRPDISVENVDKLKNTLLGYGYSGPVALSWDDTELELALSVYQDGKDTVLILGGADGPLKVTSLLDYDEVIEKAEMVEADKLRVWLITVPLPKIPPIMVAAVARGSSVDAEGLFAMHQKLIALLAAAEIYPVSLAADGSETERSTQRLIGQSAHGHRHYIIPNEQRGCPIELTIPLFYERPSVLVQDSKHGKKTGRNQLESGARFIVFANMVIFFSMLVTMAWNVLCPLFRDDVVNADKQDDRAAARLFSAKMLDFQMEHYSADRGVTVYLFVLGELIDAWQSRNISHLERARMVMRARFFLMAWRSHIVQHPDYDVNIQFISRESYEIFLNLCDSLLSLILVYRTFYPTYPLLPWLHSTEPCEHLFGMLRQLKRDFNYSDMLYLEPKLRALMLGEFGNLTAEQKANETSSGYHHTYFKADDLDLPNLFLYPTDVELSDASKFAFGETEQLLASVGIDAAAMLALHQPPAPSAPKKKAVVTTVPRQPQTMLELLAMYDGTSFQSAKEEDEFEAVEMAVAAQALDESLSIENLPDSTESSIGDTASQISALLSSNTRKTHTPLEPFKLGLLQLTNVRGELDRKVLIAQRERHETTETSKAVRQAGREWSMPQDRPQSLADTLKQRIRALGSGKSKASTSGVGRRVRYTGIFAQESEEGQGTRQRNEEVARDVAAMEFLRHRNNSFLLLLGLHENFNSANILQYNPLKPGGVVIILKPMTKAQAKKKPPQLLIGRVATMYTQAAYRGAKHEGLTEAVSVGLISYAYVQVLAPLASNFFTTISCPQLSCSTFLRIPQTHIIFSLASYDITTQEVAPNDAKAFTMFTLPPDAMQVYLNINARISALSSAVFVLKQAISGRKKVSDEAPRHISMDGDEGDDSELSDGGADGS